MAFAILYIITSFILGFWIIDRFLPSVRMSGNGVIRTWFVVVPSAYIVGTLVITTTLYALAYAFTWTKLANPLAWANGVILSGTLLFAVPGLIKHKTYSLGSMLQLTKRALLSSDTVVAITCLFISSVLMFHTLSFDDGYILLGRSVYGDMNTHISLTRSFSIGQNIPTEYPLFADENIQYHFLFYFLTGNLEFLGMPLAWAINMPSIISFTSFIMLLYAFAVLITKSKMAALLTLVLFFFRSSYAFVSFLQENKLSSLVQAIKFIVSNDKYIGSTPKESWGLWNLNVYINQRHFSFAIALLLIVLIALLTTRNFRTPDKQLSD